MTGGRVGRKAGLKTLVNSKLVPHSTVGQSFGLPVLLDEPKLSQSNFMVSFGTSLFEWEMGEEGVKRGLD